jgi:GntR family transcriptional repressor for pyruvate dehydrogenase complex
VQFGPVTRRTVAEEVRESLRQSIASGDLAPGSPLPSERSLCEQFEVARTSVREAIQGLVSIGLIERRGNRSYVPEHLPGVDFAGDNRKRSVTHIFEVRRVVEIPMARLAALRASDEERKAILRQGRSFRATMALDEFRRRDHEFHETVARACGNPALAELYNKVLETLFRSTDFDSLLGASQNKAVVLRVIREAARAHREISGCIAAGDEEGVAKAAEAHLNQVEALMVAQMT